MNIPPIYFKIRKQFDVSWDKGLIITYGDTYHCKHDIPDHFIAHEEVHMRQQKEYGIEMWWHNYLLHPDFRLFQEVEAYRAQLSFVLERYGREKFLVIYRECAGLLSSAIYDNLVTFDRALELLDLSTEVVI